MIMRYVFAVACCILLFLGVGLAVEGGQTGDGDMLGTWYKPIFDMGIAGTFIGYLIYDRHLARKDKKEENARWVRMDETLISLVKEGTASNIDLASALREARASSDELICNVQRLATVVSTGNAHSRRVTDKE